MVSPEMKLQIAFIVVWNVNLFRGFDETSLPIRAWLDIFSAASVAGSRIMSSQESASI